MTGPVLPDPTPPQWSADGSAWWDGYRWIPREQVPAQYGGGHDRLGVTLPGSRRRGSAVVAPIALVVLLAVGTVFAVAIGGFSYVTGGVFDDAPFAEGTVVVAQPEWPATRAAAVLALGRDAEEAYRSERGTYSASVEELTAYGYAPASDVFLSVVSADASRYCLQATSGDGILWLASGADTPSPTPCG